MFRNLVLGAPQWLWPASLIGVALSIIVIWNYWRGRSSASPWVLGAGATLKLVAIGLMVICLLEPMRTGTRAQPKANLFAVVVDSSRSMAMRSGRNAMTKSARVQSILTPGEDWLTRLSQDFDVRRYKFAARLETDLDTQSIAFDGESSAIASSLAALADRLGNRPVAGAMVFTDGNATDANFSAMDWSSVSFPIYPVVIGDVDSSIDLRIADVSVTQSDFETAPVTVKVSLAGNAIAGQAVTIELKDMTTQAVVASQSITMDDEVASSPVTFKFRPESAGVHFYKATAIRDADRAAVDAGQPTSEATMENNTRWVAIDRGQGPHRVLYLSGRPNWDFKFLRRAVSSDPEVRLIGLIRIANKEAKFGFRDRAVQDTNPLFAGLDDDEADIAQSYDEPVLLRLGVEADDELANGFPRTAEDLFPYEAVILDDIEADFFTEDQLLLLRRFVSFRGGSLLFMGGQESFAKKGFSGTPLGDLSPVYAASVPDESSAPTSFRMLLTREGMLQPWFRTRDTEDAENDRLSQLSPLATYNQVGDVKPGAVTLATIQPDGPSGDSQPAFVEQRFGRGRTAAMLIADSWKWSMRHQPGSEDESARWWRQVMRWLVGDVPQRASVDVQPDANDPKKMTLVVNVQTDQYLPCNNAVVTIDVSRIGDDAAPPVRLVGQGDGEAEGTYRATFYADQPGGYLATVTIDPDDGSESLTTQAGWASQPSEAEFRNFGTNRPLLDEIAKRTGGRVINESSLDSFVSKLNNEKVPITEVWTYPIWHAPWVMLAALSCLCGEWGLRRWKGLA